MINEYYTVGHFLMTRGAPSGVQTAWDKVGDADRTLKREITTLRAALAEAVEIVQLLMDVQNGPPLPKYTQDWNEAMDRCRAFIAAHTK